MGHLRKPIFLQVVDEKGLFPVGFPVNVSGTRYESLGTFVGKYPKFWFNNIDAMAFPKNFRRWEIQA